MADNQREASMVSRSGKFGREIRDGYLQEHSEIVEPDLSRLTVQCRVPECHELIIRMKRYHVEVEWELTTDVLPQWQLGTHDNGTHFHLFCAAGHESKMWGNELPKRLQKVVYPG